MTSITQKYDDILETQAWNASQQALLMTASHRWITPLLIYQLPRPLPSLGFLCVPPRTNIGIGQELAGLSDGGDIDDAIVEAQDGRAVLAYLLIRSDQLPRCLQLSRLRAEATIQGFHLVRPQAEGAFEADA